MSLTSNMKFRPTDRFFSKPYLTKHSPHYTDKNRAQCYIPTRNEIYTAPVPKLQNLLDNWLNNTPAALMPGIKQRDALLFLLRARLDRKNIGDIIKRIEETPIIEHSEP